MSLSRFELDTSWLQAKRCCLTARVFTIRNVRWCCALGRTLRGKTTGIWGQHVRPSVRPSVVTEPSSDFHEIWWQSSLKNSSSKASFVNKSWDPSVWVGGSASVTARCLCVGGSAAVTTGVCVSVALRLKRPSVCLSVTLRL